MGDRAIAELEDAQCREVKAHVAKIQAERMLRRIREGGALTTKSSWHRSAGPATPGGQIMLRRSAEMRAADDAGQDSIESPDDCCTAAAIRKPASLANPPRAIRSVSSQISAAGVASPSNRASG